MIIKSDVEECKKSLEEGQRALSAGQIQSGIKGADPTDITVSKSICFCSQSICQSARN